MKKLLISLFLLTATLPAHALNTADAFRSSAILSGAMCLTYVGISCLHHYYKKQLDKEKKLYDNQPKIRPLRNKKWWLGKASTLSLVLAVASTTTTAIGAAAIIEAKKELTKLINEIKL